jgi:putative FmdB family regulatory protein
MNRTGGEVTMPTYLYKCKDCGHEFERVMPIREHEQHAPTKCPKCQSTKVEQEVSNFEAVTSDWIGHATEP